VTSSDAAPTSPSRLLRWVRATWFIAGMLLVIGLAYATPGVGLFMGRMGASKILVVAFSFLSGIAVSLAHVRDDLKNWRTHLAIQGFTFLITPLLVYVATLWLPDGPLKYGVYVVAVVPPTLSSCIAFSMAAGGRMACALINSVAGNLLGVFISPLVLAVMIGAGEGPGTVAPGKTIGDLILLVLIPLVAGQFARVWFPVAAKHTEPYQGYAGQTCVLLLSLATFSKSMTQLVTEAPALWRYFALLAAIHVGLVAIVSAAVRVCACSMAETPAILFSATQKTLAVGLPLAESFFARRGEPVGVIILPLIFYYIFQMLFGSALIAWMQRRRPVP